MGATRGVDQNVGGQIGGDFILPGEAKLKGRKRWIAFFHHPQGALVVDDGAKAALREHGMSLLTPGIVDCEVILRRGMW